MDDMVGGSEVCCLSDPFVEKSASRNEQLKLLSKTSAGEKSKASIAIISGIYYASQNYIQQANDAETKCAMYAVTRMQPLNPPLDLPGVMTLLLRQRRRHVSIFPGVSTLPVWPNDYVVGFGFTFACIGSVIWSRRHGPWHRRSCVGGMRILLPP